MRAIFTLFLTLILVAAAIPSSAAWWGLVGCSTSDSATTFTWNDQTGEFIFSESFPLVAYGNYPYDAVMRPGSEDEIWVPGAIGDGVVIVSESGTHPT